MLVEFKDVSAVKKLVGVEIPADVIKGEVEAVTSEFAKHAKVPGFRQGKVPRHLVRSRHDEDIKSEVLERLLPKYFHEAITEKGLEAVGSPELKHVDPIVDGSTLRFDAEFEIRPVVALGEYKGLEIEEKSAEVLPDEVEKTVERFREQSATFRPITDRAAQDGDYVVIDLISSAEGLDRKTTEGYYVHLGADTTLPELRDTLIGKKPGDQVSFQKSWDEDAPNEEVRGKTVTYDVTVKELQLRELPELNDELARSIGVAESIDELRAKVEADLRRHKEQESQNHKRQQAGDQLVAAHEFDVPDTLVQDETVKALRNYARFLQSQGVDPEAASIDWEKLRDDFRPDAVKRVKLSCILGAIAKSESIEASDAEVDSEIRQGVSNASEFSAFKHRLIHDGTYDDLRRHLAEEKALELVIREARLRK